MDLKELIKEVEDLIGFKKLPMSRDVSVIKLEGIKHTVEAISNSDFGISSQTDTKLWWKLKELLSLSTKKSSNNNSKKDCIKCKYYDVCKNILHHFINPNKCICYKSSHS